MIITNMLRRFKKKKMIIQKTKLYLFLLVVVPLITNAQESCDSLYFLQCKKNKIVMNSNIEGLAEKFRKLKKDSGEKLSIVHIGDSHLQAGFFTEKIKQDLFQHYMVDDTIATPGFIFPYTIAKTNNPFYYKVYYTGDWDVCKNVDTEKVCKLGLSGITIRTNELEAIINIKMQNKKYDYSKKYFFNKIDILHNSDSKVNIKVNDRNTVNNEGLSSIGLGSLTDSICIRINNNDTSKHFELYGIILGNDKSKINYHTIGINGATAQSYLKCDYFSKHLDILKPDLVIISLGTNEGYDKELYELENEFILKDLVYQIQDVLPNVTIILTTPSDHLVRRKYHNPNIKIIRDNIFKVHDYLQLGLWDLYSIMGGKMSITEWHKMGLTGEDMVHFKKRGYEIQGELFAKALIDLIESKELFIKEEKE